MSCRHDLATGTCSRCYPSTGKVHPGPEEEYEDNMEGVGAVEKDQWLVDLAERCEVLGGPCEGCMQGGPCDGADHE